MIPITYQPASAIILLSSLASICLAAAPPQSIDPGIGSLSFPQASTTFAGIDRRFEIRPVFWGPKLQSIGCLMNAINAMTNMATQDMHETMGMTTFELDDYPNNAIALLPRNWQRVGLIERRFAVWGLSLAVYTMTGRGDYHCSTFHLLWEGIEVGTLGFSKGIIARPQLSASNNASDLQSQGLLSLDNTTAIGTPLLHIQNSTADISNRPILSSNVFPLPTVLPLEDFFMTVIGALTRLAAHKDKDAGVVDFAPDVAPIPASVSFSAWSSKSISRPPFITARHIIETLGHLPAVMLARKRFSEVDIIMKLDGVDAGLGQLRKLDGTGGSAQRTSNVTIA